MDEELKRIASQIRTWRDEAGLTLQELANKSAVSASTVHKIENLQTIPTIGVLLKVVAGLRRRPAELFGVDRAQDEVALTRLEERDALSTNEGTVLHRMVGPISGGALDVWRVTHEPGHGSRRPGSSNTLKYNGELVVVMESGELSMHVGEVAHILRPGDTLHFKTSHEHFWQNDSDAPATAIFFGMLPRGLQIPRED